MIKFNLLTDNLITSLTYFQKAFQEERMGHQRARHSFRKHFKHKQTEFKDHRDTTGKRMGTNCKYFSHFKIGIYLSTY